MMEEEYVGEGQSEDSAASETSVAKVCSALNSTMSEADIIDTLFDNCDVERVGHIQISAVINYLKNTSFDPDQENEEDFEELWLMFDKGFDDARIDQETFRQVMHEYIARNRNRKDMMSSYTEMIGNDEKLLIGYPCLPSAKPCGILNLSDVVNCSFGSLEGRGGNVSEINSDPLQLIMENEDLRLQTKNLQEKYCKQDAFVVQLEEQAAQQHLQFEKQEQTLSSLQDKNAALQQACEEWQLHLEHCEEENKCHRETIEKLGQDCNVLDAEGKHLKIELAQISVELENLRESKMGLLRLLSLQKEYCEEVEVKNNKQEEKIILQNSSLEKLQEYIQLLQKEIAILHLDKKDLKYNLTESQDELFSLQRRMSVLNGGQRVKRSAEDSLLTTSSKRAYIDCNPQMQTSLSLEEEIKQVQNALKVPNIEDSSKCADTNEDLNSLWKILVDLTEAATQAQQLANTLECGWNPISAAHHQSQCGVVCPGVENSSQLNKTKDDENVEKDCNATSGKDWKNSAEPQGLPGDMSVDLVKENICKEVKTLRIHLARSQAVLDLLMRSMDDTKTQSSQSQQILFPCYTCHHHMDISHSSPHNCSRSTWCNRAMTMRGHHPIKNISLDISGASTSTPTHRTNRRVLSCPNFSNLSSSPAEIVEALVRGDEKCPLLTASKNADQEEEQMSSPDSMRNRSHSFLAAIKKSRGERPLVLEETSDTWEKVNSANQRSSAVGGYTLPTVGKQVPWQPSPPADGGKNIREEAPSNTRTWTRGNSRRRQRGSPGSPTCIQRSAAVDFDETEAYCVTGAPFSDHRHLELVTQTSETESAKGVHSAQMDTTDPATEVICPNFNDVLLRRLQVHKESESRPETLSEPELETKFQSLCLAAKTDKLTVSKRIDLHQRQRDIAEKNVESELSSLRCSIEELRQLSLGVNAQQLLEELQSHMDVLQLSTSRLSSRAEIFGAVQQEERMCKAVEVMVLYVEGVRRLYESVQRELEQTRRLLTANCALMGDGGDGHSDEFRFGKVIRTNTLLTSGNQRRSECRSRSLQMSPTGMGRRRFSVDNMPIAQLRLGPCDLELRTRDIFSQKSDLSNGLHAFQLANHMNVEEETRKSGNCKGILEEDLPVVSKLPNSPSDEDGGHEPSLLYMIFPRLRSCSLILSPLVTMGHSRVIVGGFLLLVAILSFLLNTFANRLMFIPDAASSSVWDIVVGEMFKPSITRNQHSTQPL